MDDFSNKFDITYTDPEINEILRGLKDQNTTHTKHFNHNEEFFIRLDKAFHVPSLPIHHDMNKSQPEAEYMKNIRYLLRQLTDSVPGLFEDLIFFFQPTRILKAGFFKIYTLAGAKFLYLMEIDLNYRASFHELLEKGTNDRTAHYQTDKLFFNSIFIPLTAQSLNKLPYHFEIHQTLSDTWIGEHGRGYFTKGVWMDDELTKFFSKLFLPAECKLYPYYPFICQYKTLCQSLINFTAGSRQFFLPRLDQALSFLIPHLHKIQDELKGNNFSEDLEIFQTLKRELPQTWGEFFKNIRVEMYLNKHELREYKVELPER